MQIQYNDAPVRQMLLPALIFLVIGLFIGVFIAFNGFVAPDAFSGPYVHFGRVRPVHVGSVTLLWLLSVNMGLMYYFVPRLAGVPLFSQKLALFTTWIWWPTLIIGIFSFPFGTNFGWEYAELPMTIGGWLPIKFLVLVAWALFSFNLFATIAKRTVQKMYVSLWYVMGTLIWTSVTYIVGNFAVEWVPMGISRVNTSFFFVHNLVGLIFTPMGLAIAYYFIPKIAQVPIYSHRLSMVGFWSIAFIYAWIGAHHMLHGPQSQWLQTTSIIFSVWLIIPVWTVVANLFGTVRRSWDVYSRSVPLRFLTMGVAFYLIVCLQGSLQSLRNVNEVISKTDWIIGHAHMALLGTFSFFAIGGVYYVVPKIAKKPLWSNTLSEWHFTLALSGSVLMFAALWLGGFKQGLEWAEWATGSSYAEYQQNLSALPFLKTIEGMYWWWVARLISGVLIFFGCMLFVINIFNTLILPRRVHEAI